MLLLFKKYWPFLVLTILAFIIHLAFLSYPAQVVFDEVHFGKFVGAYFTHQYYFDIHPPLGKLIIAGFAKLTGINPVFSFDKIGETIPAEVLFYMRFLPAFFGALFVLAFSWLAYLISRSKTTALIAGFLILLDNAFLVQSRFVLVDVFMLFFEVLTLCFFFLWQRQKVYSAKWFSYLVLTGLFFGLTISIKWTGLATIGIIGVVLLAKIFSNKLQNYLSSGRLGQVPSEGRRSVSAGQGLACLSAVASAKEEVPENEGFARAALKNLKELALALLIISFLGLAVYAIPFYIHFQLLTQSGPGDAFMSTAFRNELKYGRENIFQPLNFWQKFTELNKTMYTANAGITTEHPFGSRWYSWPIDKKAVYYWNQETIAGRPNWAARIYLYGNPFLWWLALAVLILTIIKISFKKSRRKIEPIAYILILAYLVNLLPFIFIKRVAFLYHYLPSITFAILLLSLWMAQLWPKQKKIFWVIFIFVLLAFIALTPFSYGWPLPINPNLLII